MLWLDDDGVLLCHRPSFLPAQTFFDRRYPYYALV